MVGTGGAERNLCTCARIEWLRMPEIIQIPKEEKGLKHMKTKDLVLCAMFVALIAVGAFIKIPGSRNRCRTDCKHNIAFFYCQPIIFIWLTISFLSVFYLFPFHNLVSYIP